MAFNVIQKLAKELQTKEEELEESTTRMEKADKQRNALKKAKEEMDAVLEKQRGATKDLKKQIRERDRRLSLVGHQTDDAKAVLTVQLETLQTEMEQVIHSRFLFFDDFISSLLQYTFVSEKCWSDDIMWCEGS